MRFCLPDKPPEDDSKKLDILYTFVCNHLNHKVKWVDVKLNFVLVFVALILGLLGIIIAR